MDNLTHALTGALLARTLPAGWSGEPASDPAVDPDAALTRPGRWLTPAAIVAANLPDFEALFLRPPPLGDKAAYLLHHRGWSHSLVGIAAEALLFAGLLWLICRWMSPERKLRPTSAASRTSSRPVTGTCRTAGAGAPGSNGGFFAGFTPARGLAVAALGAFSHLFLDWWNSYGVRPFYPWDKTWYYGDLVFIVDPWVWLMLGGALVCGTRRFGRAKWVWYGLTSAATLAVAGACWKNLCPWWVLAAWCTGVAEVVLLRWWGRWRFAPLIAASLVGLFLGANARWTTWAVEAALAGPVLAHRYESDRIDALGAMPVPGVPWRRFVVSSVMTVGPSGRDVLQNVCFGDWDGLTDSYQHRNCTSRSPGRAEGLNIADDPEVVAWKSFARFHLGEWTHAWDDPDTPEQEGEFVMGDARYRYAPGSGGGWSEQRITVPFTGRPR